MCGIAGIIDYKRSTEENPVIIRNMLDSLNNRGPDEEGVVSLGSALFLHKRLSVIDLALSRQPMTRTFNGERYTIVYNGEMYNMDTLKDSLISLGYEFTTKGDTEVVLFSYIHYKEKCLDLFNGIFSFAIWEEKSEKLFFARDPMGVKPFFYSCQESFFIFASSVPCLLAHSRVKSEIDITSVAEIMLLGPGRSPSNAIFRDICELPRGFYGTFSHSGLSLHEYFFFSDTPHKESFEETVEKVKYLVTDAIKLQMLSDVKVGTFLSGGLDSSIISAVANEYMHQKGKTLDTFSVTYKDNSKFFKSSRFQPDSDEKYIEAMVKHLDCNHHNITLDTPEVIACLYKVIDEKALPSMADVESSLLAFCSYIKPVVTVALSGECADEIFGGYPWFSDKTIREKEGFPWAQNTLYRREFINPSLLDKIQPDYVIKKYKEAVEDVFCQDPSPLEKRMREMFILNVDHFMQTLLTRKDCCSMYSSLEVRVPFCDKRISEYLYSVPWKFKNYSGREKGLLRKAFEDILPYDIVWRKKSPYPKTHNPCYLSALKEIFSPLLKDKDNPLWAIVNIDRAKALLDEESSRPFYGQLMTTPQTIAYFIQLEYWIRKFSVRLV